MKPNKLLFFLSLALLSALTLVWLIAHVVEVYPISEQFNMADPDSMLFARITEQSILKGKTLKSDDYGAFPYTIEHGLPPFYMFFLYAVANVFFVVFPKSNLDPMWVVGTLPIIFTWLTALTISFFLWFLTKNKGLTLFCTLALLPGFSASMNSAFLKLDYDFLISFFIWAWLLNLALLINKPHLKDIHGFFKNITLLGAAISILFHATWAGVPMFFFIVTLLGFILWLINHPKAPIHNAYAAHTMFLGALCNLIYIYFNEPSAQLISINKYSYFQPLTSLAAALFLYALGSKFLANIRAHKTQKILGVIILLLATLGLGVLFREQVAQGLGFILKKDPIHATISELRPLFTFSKGAFVPTNFIQEMVNVFGYMAFLLPLLVFLPLKGFRPSTGQFLKVWLLIMIGLSIAQIRYVRWSSIGLSLYSGILLYNFWIILSKHLNNKSFKKLRLVGIFLPLLLLYLSLNFQAIITINRMGNDFTEALSWIKKYTPETSGYFNEEVPQYSILSYWDCGNAINYYAHRPSSTNNAMWGYKTMADVFSALTEKEALALCEKYKIKYILTEPSRGHPDIIYNYWPTFKDMPEVPEYSLSSEPSEAISNYEDYLYFWLIDNLGLTPRAGFEATEHFRLVYVGNTQKNIMVYPYTLFERVEGAKIALELPPNTEAQLSLSIMLDGKEFLYKKKGVSNETGILHLRVPYSNMYLKGRVKTHDFYKISYEQDEKTIKAFALVSEEDVQNGNEVRAQLL